MRQVDVLMVLRPINLNNSLIHAGYLSKAEQDSLVADLRKVAMAAPFQRFSTRFGKQIGVQMTSAGDYGWFSDQNGYRYVANQCHGAPWPEIPNALIHLWRNLTSADRDPQCCLINYYGEGVRMGLHQDNDEADFGYPVLSISLGDDALFRVGGSERHDPTQSVWLKSGDVVLLSGSSRLAYHGIDKTRFGSSSLLKKGGRLNVTLRVVD